MSSSLQECISNLSGTDYELTLTVKSSASVRSDASGGTGVPRTTTLAVLGDAACSRGRAGRSTRRGASGCLRKDARQQDDMLVELVTLTVATVVDGGGAGAPVPEP